MSLLRSLERRHTPEPVTGQTLLDILGKNLKTASGVKVTQKNALALTSVFRAVALISGTVAQLPLKTFYKGTPAQVRAYRELRNQTELAAREGASLGELRDLERQLHDLREEANSQISHRSHETTVRVVNRPNTIQTGFELRERQTAHLALWGNSYAMKIRDGSNRVVELWPLIPDYVKPKLVGDRKVFEINPPSGDRIVTDASEILHIPGFGYDGLVGLSPIGMAREAVASGIAAEKYSAGIFKSGAMAGGLITTPRRLSGDQAKNIKQRWKDQIGGVENAYEIGVLDQGMKFERLTMPPTDIQFIESRQFSVVEIARLYGVPPHLLMDVDRSTSWGTGIEEQTIGFVTFTVQPGYLTRIETRYSLEAVPSNQFAEFKVEGLLRGSSKVRADVYSKALDPKTGWMERSEVRALENLPPEPEDPEEEPDEDPGEPELDVEDDESASRRARYSKYPIQTVEESEDNTRKKAMSRAEYVKWKNDFDGRAYTRGRQ